MNLMDPVLLAAHALHTSPGSYAVLLGSGVSSAAGIPTGWSITLDLIERVSSVDVGERPDDLLEWYRERVGGEPDYSKLLDSLAGTSVERQSILRRYIEPTEEERSSDLKTPTAAHRAIAELVRSGHIRVVVTTNFDRLMEQALADAGVDFDVIWNVDTKTGARPLGQAPCTVVKVHGDYRDSRILNTASELSEYPTEMNALLDRIFDEYGLIVCGWSAVLSNWKSIPQTSFGRVAR